jgi:hypothetical protein
MLRMAEVVGKRQDAGKAGWARWVTLEKSGWVKLASGKFQLGANWDSKGKTMEWMKWANSESVWARWGK